VHGYLPGQAPTPGMTYALPAVTGLAMHSLVPMYCQAPPLGTPPVGGAGYAGAGYYAMAGHPAAAGRPAAEESSGDPSAEQPTVASSP